MGKLSNNDYIDQVIEKLQEGDAALFRLILRHPRRLPPAAKTDSFQHDCDFSSVN